MNSARFNFASYDFSNSGYLIIFQSFLLPMYLAAVFGAGDGEEPIIWA